MMTAESPTLSIAEAAQRLHVSPKTVRQRIKRGEIHAGLVEGAHGPEYRVPVSSLEIVPKWHDFSPGAGNGTLNIHSGRVGNGTVEVDNNRLNAQAQRAGQATLNGTLEGENHGSAPLPGNGTSENHGSDHRAEMLEQQRDQALADVEFLRQQLVARTEAEAQLRAMMMHLERTNAQLTEALLRPALPPHVETPAPKKVRWWALWRRS